MKVVEVEELISFLRKNKYPKVGELHRTLLQMSFELPDFPKNSKESNKP